MNYPNTDLTANSLITVSNYNEISLEQVQILLSHEHDDQTVLELMRKFCIQSSSADISKKGMEFLYMNGYYTDLQLLIDKNQESENSSNRQWAEVYQLVLDRRLGRIPALNILRLANRIKTEEPELKAVIEFVKTTAFYELRAFGEMGNVLQKQLHLFESVEDPFLLSYFNMRLYQNLFVYYWVRNELIMARKYAFRVLNQTKNIKTKASIHVNLGLTYTFDTYFQGMYHLTEGLKLSNKYNFQGLATEIKQRNIPFLSAHFRKPDGIKTDDKSEIAHLEIAKGNYEKAVAILETVPGDSPFKLYYLGVAKHDKNILLQSYNYFIEKQSDYFFGRLPLNALKQFG